jgi:hypothetical protein
MVSGFIALNDRPHQNHLNASSAVSFELGLEAQEVVGL